MKKLSIAVITMNRSEQLIEALESCLSSKLPDECEFVVLDNASTDDTAEKIKHFSQSHPEADINYHYSSANLGVGGGRSKAFELAQGEYVYFLDDDAVISDESKESFFIKSIDTFEQHPEIASITTNIYDELWKCDRDVRKTKNTIAGLQPIYYYLGGSHFLRKAYFDIPLYFDIKYGSEEYAPSIYVQNKGYFNVFDKELCIIHKPKVNKWVQGSESMKKVHIFEIANVYATKRIVYPAIFALVLWAGFTARCSMHLKNYSGAAKEAKTTAKALIKSNKGAKRVKISTVLKLIKNFGFGAL